jgi:hydroxymethylpyrimidine/phosphomethylpyrimidine kinase
MSTAVACTVAGSDSGGGAGIQADLKSFAACGVYGTSVIVALTAQNTLGVRAIELVSTGMVADQIDAVAEDLRPAAWKTGMLGTAEVIEVVGERFLHHRVEALVVDPVMVAKSGDRLLAEAAVDALKARLLPLALVVTPNLPEAEVLLGRPVATLEDARAAARELVGLGPHLAVVKGGHRHGDRVVDVIYDKNSETWTELVYPRIETSSTHGTGCTLSAATAAFLARGVAPLDAVASARAYLQETLSRAPGLGGGHGPLGHFPAEVAAPVVPAAAPVR